MLVDKTKENCSQSLHKNGSELPEEKNLIVPAGPPTWPPWRHMQTINSHVWTSDFWRSIKIDDELCSAGWVLPIDSSYSPSLKFPCNELTTSRLSKEPIRVAHIQGLWTCIVFLQCLCFMQCIVPTKSMFYPPDRLEKLSKFDKRQSIQLIMAIFQAKW